MSDAHPPPPSGPAGGQPHQPPATSPPQDTPRSPAAPPPPPLSPPGPGGRRRGLRGRLIAGAVTATLLLAGGGTWLAVSDDGDTTSDTADSNTPWDEEAGVGTSITTGKLQHAVRAPAVDEPHLTPGFWVTPTGYAKGAPSAVVGYGHREGKEKWRVPLSGDLCAASERATDEGKVAVVFGRDASGNGTCSHVAVIDLTTGEKDWQRTVTGAEGAPAHLEGTVALAGGTVAAAGSSGGYAWTVAGDPLWTPRTDRKCRAQKYMGGEALVAVAHCVGLAGPRNVLVRTVNPRTGEPTASYRPGNGVARVEVVSTSPVVLANRSAGGVEFTVLSQKGSVRARVQVPGELGLIARYAVVGGGQLYVPVVEDGNSGLSHEIVVRDLNTGDEVSRVTASEYAILQPLGMSNGTFLAYEWPNKTDDQGGVVLSSDPKTHEVEPVMATSDSSAQREFDFMLGSEKLRYVGDRLYMAHQSVKPDSRDAVLVFGPA